MCSGAGGTGGGSNSQILYPTTRQGVRDKLNETKGDYPEGGGYLARVIEPNPDYKKKTTTGAEAPTQALRPRN